MTNHDVSMPAWWAFRVECAADFLPAMLVPLRNAGCRACTRQKMDDRRDVVTAYFGRGQVDGRSLAILADEVRRLCREAGLPAPVITWLSDVIWECPPDVLKTWMPKTVGRRFTLQPAGLPDPPPSDRWIIRLNPDFAFGLGGHPTTVLCLEVLEMLLAPVVRLGDVDISIDPGAVPSSALVSDIGCGSGVLSLAALLLGATRVVAVDTDELAVACARKNRDLNQILPDCLEVELGSIDRLAELLPRPVDGFLCNIAQDALQDLIPRFQEFAARGAWGVISGFRTDEVPNIRSLLERNQCQIRSLRQKGEWGCALIQRR